MKRILSVIVIIIVILIPLPAQAHGLAVTQQQIVDKYLVEFENDSTGKTVAGELTSYNFELLEKEGDHIQVPYERVSVKFTKQGAGRAEFSANLLPVSILGRKSSRANITISESGIYTADLSFYSGEALLAKANFNFEIAANAIAADPEKKGINGYIFVGIFAMLLLVIIIETFWLYSYKYKSR